jgi:hypothetical protein
MPDAEKDRGLKPELDALRTLRDELRVQMNLAGKDARSLFESAEKTWQKLEGRVRLVGRETQDELANLRKAAKPLMDELHRAYARIRELI